MTINGLWFILLPIIIVYVAFYQSKKGNSVIYSAAYSSGWMAVINIFMFITFLRPEHIREWGGYIAELIGMALGVVLLGGILATVGAAAAKITLTRTASKGLSRVQK